MKALLSVCIGLALSSVAIAQAQSVTTSGGTANKLPKFTSSTAIADSAITETAGYVGIGTTSPNVPLQIVGTNDVLKLGESNNSVGKQLIFAVNNSGNGYGSIQSVWQGNQFTDLLLNRSGGKVGIGTVPSSQLSVKSAANTTGYTIIGDYIVTNNSDGSQWTRLMVSQNSTNTMLLDVNNQIDTKGNLLLMPWGGSVGVGTTTPSAKLEVNGNVKLSGAGSSITFGDGTVQTTAWNGSLCGGDYAESVDVNGDRVAYGPGDVLTIDPDNPGRFLKSAEPYSTTVLGVYSTRPGAVGRRQGTPKSSDEVPMAMVGIVPTKVSAENGPIRPGDLLVSSSIPGYAMKGTDRTRMLGAVIGKALGRLESGTGVIEVGVTLQ